MSSAKIAITIDPGDLEELDELFAPCRFPASGKHGLEVRLPSGAGLRPEIDPSALDDARRWLRGLPLKPAGTPVRLTVTGDVAALPAAVQPGLRARLQHGGYQGGRGMAGVADGTLWTAGQHMGLHGERGNVDADEASFQVRVFSLHHPPRDLGSRQVNGHTFDGR